MNETNEPTNTQLSLRQRLGTVPVGARGIQLSNLEDIFRFAKAVALSQLCPPGFTENDCFLIIENGLEVGMSPMAALASTYIVNNRATIFGDMPLALVRQSGYCESYKQEEVGTFPKDDYGYKITTKRKDAPEPIVTTYTVEDAKIAEVWGKTFERNGKTIKGPWSTAPKRMLLFRARGFNLRDNFGDVLKGCAIAELADDGNEPGFEHAKEARGARIVEPNFVGGTAAASNAPPASPSPDSISKAEENPKRPVVDDTAGPSWAPSAPMIEPPKRRGRPPGSRNQVPGTLFDQKPAEPAREPESKPEPAVAATPGPADIVLRRLEDQKLDPVLFVAVMNRNGFVVGEGKTLNDVSEDGLATALDQWETTVDLIRELEIEKAP